MARFRRAFAYLLLAVLLPIQGFAGACAQICAVVSSAHEMPVELDAGSPGHEDCGKSDIGAGKCCQGHVYLGAPLATVPASLVPDFQPQPLVARWVSFIPEEPSPPPIVAATRA